MSSKVIKNHRLLINDLVSKLPRKAKKGGDKKTWTKAVKAVMKELWGVYCKGHKEEFCAIYPKSHEWLLDVVWYPKDKSSESIVLALESEWADSPKECSSDFCKLLATKAPLKIFLFEAGKYTKNTADQHLDSLEAVCRKWQQHNNGDLIYAINFADGEHTTYFYKVPKDGPIPKFKFKEIAQLSGAD